MKLSVALVLAAAVAARCTPKPDDPPPDLTGQCAVAERGPDGAWVVKRCPPFGVPPGKGPGNGCIEIPPNPSQPYPDCVS